MRVALMHDHFSAKKIEDVKQQMAVIGSPVIKAVYLECYDIYAALEGCHRLRVAHELGIDVIIDEVAYSDLMLSDIGCLDEFGEDYTISEICDDAYRNIILDF